MPRGRPRKYPVPEGQIQPGSQVASTDANTSISFSNSTVTLEAPSAPSQPIPRETISDEEEPIPELPKQRVVRTTEGSQAEIDPESYDLTSLDNFKPYIDGEKLPEPLIKKNTKGISYLNKPGDPRFYFNGDEFIKVYRGLAGKKTVLFWRYNGKKALHRRIRNFFRQKGFPGA